MDSWQERLGRCLLFGEIYYLEKDSVGIDDVMERFILLKNALNAVDCTFSGEHW
jgi:hypothetical protein